MALYISAVVGEWYQDINGRLFEVVAIDEDEGTIDIQLFEGEVDSMEQESWWQLAVVDVDPPKDWSDVFDWLERDETRYAEPLVCSEAWPEPLAVLEPEPV